jgi:outer membrane protein, protease secretion system
MRAAVPECRLGRALHARAALILIVTVAAFVQPRHAEALGLVDAYEAALGHDPIFAQAQKQKEADDANRGIGRSYLLPSLSASDSESRQKTNTTNFGQGQTFGTSNVYKAYSREVDLRQPLLNFESISRYRYGKALALQGDATFDDRKEDLLVRVLTAYTDTVFAQEQLSLALAHKKTLDEQLSANQAMFQNGQGTRTDILETVSKSELAEADISDARDSLDNFAHALEVLTGLPTSLDVAGLDRLKDSYTPAMPSPVSFDQWRDIAVESNATLIAERHAVEAAHQQLNIVRAGFMPHVDLVASVGQNQSNTVDVIGQRFLTKTVGVQLTIPLFSGGLVQASSRQAHANYERMQFELQEKTDKVLLELRKQFNTCVSSMRRIDALKSAVDSATLLIEATQKGIQAGQRTNLDLLTAQEQLYQAKRDLTRARYQYLLANLQLKYAAGILTAQDLYQMAQWFVPSSAAAQASKTNSVTILVH